MLVLLLVASLMANIDVTNLETTEEIEETGARSGADAEVVAITSPKETACNPRCSNTLLVGQATNFEVYIQNSGDQDLTEMGYRVSIYLADQQGSPSMLAKDQSGQDLFGKTTTLSVISTVSSQHSQQSCLQQRQDKLTVRRE